MPRRPPVSGMEHPPLPATRSDSAARLQRGPASWRCRICKRARMPATALPRRTSPFHITAFGSGILHWRGKSPRAPFVRPLPCTGDDRRRAGRSESTGSVRRLHGRHAPTAGLVAGTACGSRMGAWPPDRDRPDFARVAPGHRSAVLDPMIAIEAFRTAWAGRPGQRVFKKEHRRSGARLPSSPFFLKPDASRRLSCKSARALAGIWRRHADSVRHHGTTMNRAAKIAASSR